MYILSIIVSGTIHSIELAKCNHLNLVMNMIVLSTRNNTNTIVNIFISVNPLKVFSTSVSINLLILLIFWE